MPDGTFQLRVGHPGTVRLRAEHDRLVPSAMVRLDVQAEETDVVLELTDGATIRGRIFGLPPERLDQIEVWAKRENDDRQGTVRSDATYIVEGLATGDWDVEARLGYQVGRRARGKTTVYRARGEALLDLVFPEGYRLRGTVLLDGKPLAEASIWASCKDFNHRRETELDGRFEIEDVPGDCSLMVIPKCCPELMVERSLELRRHEDIVVELESR